LAEEQHSEEETDTNIEVDDNSDCDEAHDNDNNVHCGEGGNIITKAENAKKTQKGFNYDKERHIQWIIIRFLDVSGNFLSHSPLYSVFHLHTPRLPLTSHK
jgi:hypothetical protein